MILIQRFSLIIKMAFRNTLRQRRRSIIVGATAAVGIFSVTLSQGFMNGFFDSMVIVAIETGLGHVQIRPAGYTNSRLPGMALEHPGELEEKFRNSLPEGVRYAPRMEREAILRVGSGVQGVMLMGVEPSREKGVSSYSDWMVRGSYLEDLPAEGEAKSDPLKKPVPCLIGTGNAKNLEMDVGDRLVVSTAARDGATRSFLCHIAGIFRSPSSLLDESMVILRRSDLSAIRNNGYEGEVSYFVFLGKDYEKAGAIKKRIQESIGKRGGAEVLTFGDLEPSINTLFEFSDQFTWIFYFIILSGFGIVLFESVTMSIFERIHEIGIIHAIGTRPSFLFWMVIVEASILTMIGVFLGLLLGGPFIYLINYIGVNFEGLTMGAQSWGGDAGVVHPYLTLKNLIDGVVIALIVSLFSGIYPALKAVRISPIRAIYNR